MRKKGLPEILTICTCLFFAACNTATPEQYFDIAVLNTNMFAGFAGEGQLRELTYPSVKMGKNKEPVVMQRSEVVNTKLQFLEVNFTKLKELKETDDTKDMLQSSRALYEHVLPVYKAEYVQLAKLYDGDASNEQIQLQAKTIHDKYYPQYHELYLKLIGIGKSYAERHAIKVNWGQL